jgi:hypothetical protein
MTLSKQSRLLPTLNDEPTLSGLVRGLFSGVVAAVRQNKLAAVLALFACVFVSFLAFTIQYDERPRYRQTILPSIQKAESDFQITMDNAEHAPNDVWRLHYFLTGHLKARDALRVARDRQPTTSQGIAAHADLIRYYQLVNEEMAIIRTQMSVDVNMDYWAEWKRQREQLEPLHEKWRRWIDEK